MCDLYGGSWLVTPSFSWQDIVRSCLPLTPWRDEQSQSILPIGTSVMTETKLPPHQTAVDVLVSALNLAHVEVQVHLATVSRIDREMICPLTHAITTIENAAFNYIIGPEVKRNDDPVKAVTDFSDGDSDNDDVTYDADDDTIMCDTDKVGQSTSRKSKGGKARQSMGTLALHQSIGELKARRMVAAENACVSLRCIESLLAIADDHSVWLKKPIVTGTENEKTLDQSLIHLTKMLPILSIVAISAKNNPFLLPYSPSSADNLFITSILDPTQSTVYTQLQIDIPIVLIHPSSPYSFNPHLLLTGNLSLDWPSLYHNKQASSSINMGGTPMEDAHHQATSSWCVWDELQEHVQQSPERWLKALELSMKIGSTAKDYLSFINELCKEQGTQSLPDWMPSTCELATSWQSALTNTSSLLSSSSSTVTTPTPSLPLLPPPNPSSSTSILFSPLNIPFPLLLCRGLVFACRDAYLYSLHLYESHPTTPSIPASSTASSSSLSSSPSDITLLQTLLQRHPSILERISSSTILNFLTQIITSPTSASASFSSSTSSSPSSLLDTFTHLINITLSMDGSWSFSNDIELYPSPLLATYETLVTRLRSLCLTHFTSYRDMIIPHAKNIYSQVKQEALQSAQTDTSNPFSALEGSLPSDLSARLRAAMDEQRRRNAKSSSSSSSPLSTSTTHVAAAIAAIDSRQDNVSSASSSSSSDSLPASSPTSSSYTPTNNTSTTTLPLSTSSLYPLSHPPSSPHPLLPISYPHLVMARALDISLLRSSLTFTSNLFLTDPQLFTSLLLAHLPLQQLTSFLSSPTSSPPNPTATLSPSLTSSLSVLPTLSPPTALSLTTRIFLYIHSQMTLLTRCVQVLTKQLDDVKRRFNLPTEPERDLPSPPPTIPSFTLPPSEQSSSLASSTSSMTIDLSHLVPPTLPISLSQLPKASRTAFVTASTGLLHASPIRGISFSLLWIAKLFTSILHQASPLPLPSVASKIPPTLSCSLLVYARYFTQAIWLIPVSVSPYSTTCTIDEVGPFSTNFHARLAHHVSVYVTSHLFHTSLSLSNAFSSLITFVWYPPLLLLSSFRSHLMKQTLTITRPLTQR